jgi:hypothetical protein
MERRGLDERFDAVPLTILLFLGPTSVVFLRLEGLIAVPLIALVAAAIAAIGAAAGARGKSGAASFVESVRARLSPPAAALLGAALLSGNTGFPTTLGAVLLGIGIAATALRAGFRLGYRRAVRKALPWGSAATTACWLFIASWAYALVIAGFLGEMAPWIGGLLGVLACALFIARERPLPLPARVTAHEGDFEDEGLRGYALNRMLVSGGLGLGLALTGALSVFGSLAQFVIARVGEHTAVIEVEGPGGGPAVGAPVFLDRGDAIIERYITDSTGHLHLPLQRREYSGARYLICVPGGIPMVGRRDETQVGVSTYQYTASNPRAPWNLHAYGWRGPTPRECPATDPKFYWRPPNGEKWAVVSEEPNWSGTKLTSRTP